MRTTIITIVLAGTLFLTMGCRGGKKSTSEKHEGQEENALVSEEHDGYEEGSIKAAEPDLCVILTPAKLEAIKVTLGIASTEHLVRELELPGKIGPVQENILHAAARFSGIAKQSARNIGDEVRIGDTLAVIESNENLSTYPILASRNGIVIEKHIVSGEYVEAGRDLFVIADLSRVAVTIAIFGADAEIAVRGATVHVMSLTDGHEATGTIDYISPFHNEQTRSLEGRMVLPNSRGIWKPGAYVRLRIQHKEPNPALLVPNEAIQLLDGKPHVFIPETAVEFKAIPITINRKGAYKTEIIKGLSVGDTLVVLGSFELKTQFAIQAMGEGDLCSH